MATKTRDVRGIQARQAALRTMLEAHRDEYDETHRAERVTRGLPSDPKRLRPADEVARLIAKTEAQLANLRAELAYSNGTA